MDPSVDFIRRHSRPIALPSPAPQASGALPRRARAVLFDVYGTLFAQSSKGSIDSRSRRKISALIRRHRLGVTPSGLASILRAEITRDRAALRASGIRDPEIRIERIWAKIFPGREEMEIRRLAVEWETAVNPVWPMPGCAELLVFLRARGIVLGIVSNSQFYTPLLFEALLGGEVEDLGFRPDLCVYSYMTGEAKPGLSIYRRAIRGLENDGIGRHETLMVGNDPANDIAPAASCGLMTALLAGVTAIDAAERPGESGVSPDAVIGRLGDLETLLA